jgi:23S rRNA (adenine-N6)-dimethyltransferase
VAAPHGARWGYHRLVAPWPERLAAAAGISPGDLVIDVGAGDGALTAALLAHGARVVAVELHPGRARALRRRFVDQPVIVVEADASDLYLPRRAFRVVANPPFAATAGLLRRLTAPGSRLIRADLVLPAGVARRWLDGAVKGSARWSRLWEASHGLRLPTSAFSPPARRAVAVLRIERLGASSGSWRTSAPR